MRLAALMAVAVSVCAQEPKVQNARMERHSAAGGLESLFRSLVAAQTAPGWIGYSVPTASGRFNSCCWNGCCGGCSLEGGRSMGQTVAADGVVRLEGSPVMFVLYRAEQGRIGKIRTFSLDCPIDAGGLPIHWLTDVNPAQSVALLSTFPEMESAIGAIAFHAGPQADAALEKLTATGMPDKTREKATFWLGNARGRRGYEILRGLLQNDPSDRLREKTIFALTQSKEPEAIPAIIQAAKNDKSPHVRGQALFWLAQTAGKAATASITNALENDPDTEVKKKAVFALSQLPKDEGVPLLIQVARTNRNAVARKQAMFWLGQSKDARALAFFEEVLVK